MINHTATFPTPTNDQRELVATAVRAFRAEWETGSQYLYKKAGVIVWDICSGSAVQADLLDAVDRGKQARLAAAIDAINRKNGFNMVKVAVQGTDKRWHLKCEHKSGRFTTNLDEIIRIKT